MEKRIVGHPRGHAQAPIVPPVEELGGNDAVLFARAQQGDTAAFALLYRRHVNQIYGSVARRLVDRAAAEEATQEDFVRALAGLGRFEARRFGVGSSSEPLVVAPDSKGDAPRNDGNVPVVLLILVVSSNGKDVS